MKEFWQEMLLFHDVALFVFYPTKDIHSQEREYPLSTSDLLDFTLETAALKYNNSDECELSNTIITIACLIILQAWPVKQCKNHKKATCLKNSPLTDQSALKKITHELSRTKEGVKKEKDSGGERACKYSSIVFPL